MITQYEPEIRTHRPRREPSYCVWSANYPQGIMVVGIGRVAYRLGLSLYLLKKNRSDKHPFSVRESVWSIPFGLEVYGVKEGCYVELRDYENFLELKHLKASLKNA